MKREAVRLQSYVKQLCCDRCGREAEIDDSDCEFHEFTSVDLKAGYGSVFGDGSKVEVDLCQHCLKETLGGGCGQKIGLVYAVRPRLARYSVGLSEPRDIFIRFSLYQ